MSETLTMNAEVEIMVWDVCLGGVDLDFKAELDSSDDIRIEITADSETILEALSPQDIVDFLERRGYSVEES